MAKICKNCGCYEVCIFANPNRTEDCDINWQPIITYCENCTNWDPEHSYEGQGWCSKVVGYRYGNWHCAAGKPKEADH
jgi:hypothetical protein